jgi:hypothetical protein
MDSFRDVVNCWESAEQLAADLKEKGVTVRQWRNRDSIPPEYWPRLVVAATGRGFSDVTLELLAALAARRRSLAGDELAGVPVPVGAGR